MSRFDAWLSEPYDNPPEERTGGPMTATALERWEAEQETYSPPFTFALMAELFALPMPKQVEFIRTWDMERLLKQAMKEAGIPCSP